MSYKTKTLNDVDYLHYYKLNIFNKVNACSLLTYSTYFVPYEVFRVLTMVPLLA
jgi:hypothetical protein